MPHLFSKAARRNQKYRLYAVILLSMLVFLLSYDSGSASYGIRIFSKTGQPGEQKSYAPVPVVPVVYDEEGNYRSRETWTVAFELDKADVLARAMLAEENEKLFDIRRVEDVIGAGWVMENRTRSDSFLYAAGEDALLDIILGGGQFALGGVMKDGKRLPGNAAIVANPEAYSAWFGDDPRGRYWTAYEYARGILGHKISDPTFGALYFVDAYYEKDEIILPFPDGRTRFNIVYSPIGNYSIPEMRLMNDNGKEFWANRDGVE